jgi:hypothetical protein
MIHLLNHKPWIKKREKLFKKIEVDMAIFQFNIRFDV